MRGLQSHRLLHYFADDNISAMLLWMYTHIYDAAALALNASTVGNFAIIYDRERHFAHIPLKNNTFCGDAAARYAWWNNAFCLKASISPCRWVQMREYTPGYMDYSCFATCQEVASAAIGHFSSPRLFLTIAPRRRIHTRRQIARWILCVLIRRIRRGMRRRFQLTYVRRITAIRILGARWYLKIREPIYCFLPPSISLMARCTMLANYTIDGDESAWCATLPLAEAYWWWYYAYADGVIIHIASLQPFALRH